MNDFVAPHDLSAKVLTNRLVPKANPHQGRPRFRCSRCQSQANTGLCRVTGTGRQQYGRRFQRHRLLHIQRVVAMFRELREGLSQDGKLKLKTPSGSLSTAEAISVTIGAWAEAGHFRSGAIDAESLAAHLVGAVVKDPVADAVALHEYLETVVRNRKHWKDLYHAIREVV